jgi:hypothetical protein
MSGGSRKKLKIKEILDHKGKGIQVLLVNGRAVWFPARLIDIKLDDQGERVIDMPAWLYDRKKQELVTSDHTHE